MDKVTKILHTKTSHYNKRNINIPNFYTPPNLRIGTRVVIPDMARQPDKNTNTKLMRLGHK